MSCFDKIHYKDLKKEAKASGLRFVINEGDNFVAVFSQPRNGMRMIEVAVSFCSPEDEFVKKHGKYQALIKFFSGESIQLPLGHLDLDEIAENIDMMFSF